VSSRRTFYLLTHSLSIDISGKRKQESSVAPIIVISGELTSSLFKRALHNIELISVTAV